MSFKFSKIVGITNNLFVITVILTLLVCYKDEIVMINYAKPNQKLGVVRYNRGFAIAVIVITEFDCTYLKESKELKLSTRMENSLSIPFVTSSAKVDVKFWIEVTDPPDRNSMRMSWNQIIMSQ